MLLLEEHVRTCQNMLEYIRGGSTEHVGEVFSAKIKGRKGKEKEEEKEKKKKEEKERKKRRKGKVSPAKALCERCQQMASSYVERKKSKEKRRRKGKVPQQTRSVRDANKCLPREANKAAC